MNHLQIFNNKQFGCIRTIEENGKPLFCGSDIARALNYTNPNKAINDHCRAITKRSTPISGKEQEINFITEGDVYRLITHSKLPAAEQFESWVFDEVLPTMRKTGGYVSNDELFVNTYLQFADDQTKALFRNTLHTITQLNTQIEEDKPKVLFANAVESSQTSVLIGDLAKLLRQNGVNIGQNRLFDWLRDRGYLIKFGDSRNMPTQKAMDMHLFEVMERTVTNPDGTVRITKTTKVTGKGQTYFVNKFLA